MMPIQAQAEILSGLAQVGDIRQGEKESLTVFFLRAAAGLGDPAAGAVFTQYPVFAGKDAAVLPLRNGWLVNPLPVVWMDQIQVGIGKKGGNLLSRIAGQIQKAVVDM